MALKKCTLENAPCLIYEMHLGSWKYDQDANRPLSIEKS